MTNILISGYFLLVIQRRKNQLHFIAYKLFAENKKRPQR